MKKRAGTDKKRKLNINIHLSNRWLYTFIVLGIIAVLTVGVYAAVDTTQGWHPASQVDFAGGFNVPSGNVGIGITSPPSEKLEVAGTIQATGFKLPTDAGAGKVLTSDAAGLATWQTPSGGGGGGTSGWTTSSGGIISTNNRVGIGTGGPLAKLYVRGGSYLPSTNAANQGAYALGADSIAAGRSIYSYGRICVGNSLGNCEGTGGTVLTTNSISTTGTVYTSGTISAASISATSINGVADIIGGCEWKWSSWLRGEYQQGSISYFRSPGCPSGKHPISCATQCQYTSDGEYCEDAVTSMAPTYFSSWGSYCRVLARDTLGGIEHRRKVGALCCLGVPQPSGDFSESCDCPDSSTVNCGTQVTNTCGSTTDPSCGIGTKCTGGKVCTGLFTKSCKCICPDDSTAACGQTILDSCGNVCTTGKFCPQSSDYCEGGRCIPKPS